MRARFLTICLPSVKRTNEYRLRLVHTKGALMFGSAMKDREAQILEAVR